MSETPRDPRSRIPGIDVLLLEAADLVARFGREETTRALRAALALGRPRVADGTWGHAPEESAPWMRAARRELERRAAPSLRPVINATGVVLHTNLGRARLAPAAVAAAENSGGYSNLEFDLEAGERGSRYDHARELLRELTGAEDALVVNNCAGGLLLALSALARGREVVISRGELVEIGGGFRIPEVLERAGASLHEVGTTNRTRGDDYEAAADSVAVATLLKVHRSNFALRGFTQSVSLEALVEIARRRNLSVVHDLGSGLLIDPAKLSLPEEPSPAQSVAAGADAVVFSGDKLLGGPQAGLIVGRSEAIAAMRRDPLCRAFRVDKGRLAALEATLKLYRDEATALAEIPTLRALTESLASLRDRTEALRVRLEALLPSTVTLEVRDAIGRVGGGTFPDHEIPSCALRIQTEDDLGEWVRRCRVPDWPATPVVGRTEDDAWVLDLRCVDPGEEDALVETLVAGGPA